MPAGASGFMTGLMRVVSDILTNKVMVYGAGIGLTIMAGASALNFAPAQRVQDSTGQTRWEVRFNGSERGSGSTTWEGAIASQLLALPDCDVKAHSGSGALYCGTDATGGGGGSATVNTGAILTAGHPRFVNVSGDTMTGKLLINAGADGLEVIGVASGRVLHAQDQLRSSGSLVVEGAAVFGSIVSCANLKTDANGAVTCNGAVYLATSTGSLESRFNSLYFRSSTGALAAAFDRRYVNTAGDTMTGALTITGSQLKLRGTLAKEGALYLYQPNGLTGATLRPTQSGATFNTYYASGTNLFMVKSDGTQSLLQLGTPHGGGTNYLSIAATDTNVTETLRGFPDLQRIEHHVDFSGGTYSLWIQQGGYQGVLLNASTSDGNYVTVSPRDPAFNSFIIDKINAGGTPQTYINASGSMVINETGDGDAYFRVEGDTKANLLYVNGLTERIGIGTATPDTALEIIGTGSASLLTVSGLKSCSAVETNVAGEFLCGVDDTGGGGGSGTFGSGNVLTIGSANYVRKQGDTMTGALVILNTLEAYTASGRILHAQDRLASSGTFVVRGNQTAPLIITDMTNGRVGVGTAAPQALMEITGGDIRFGNEANTPQHILFRRNAATLGGIGTQNTGVSIFGGTTATSHIYVRSNGNVGIGRLNINPGAPLSLSGSMVISPGSIPNSLAAEAGFALEILGAMSGRLLHAQDQLRSSGSLTVEGATVLASLAGCANVKGSADGLLSCNATDYVEQAEIDTISELETVAGGVNIILSGEIDTLAELETIMAGINIIAATEIDTMAELEAIVAGTNIIQAGEIDTIAEIETLAAGVNIIVSGEIDTFAELDTLVADKALTNAEDAFTWASLQTFTSGFKAIGVGSGRTLHAQDSLRSSGSLLVDGAVVVFGNSAFASCTALETNSAGALVCGVDDSGGTASTFGSGNVLTIGNSRYVSKQGSTMTGALFIVAAGGNRDTVSFETPNTASGLILHAQDLLRSSGALAIEGAAAIGGTVTAGDFVCSTAGCIGAAELGTDSVAADEIAAGAVGISEIATDGVEAAEIAAGAVGTSEIATDGVDAAELVATAVAANTYGTALNIPQFTVDADGRLTAASVNTIAGITGTHITDDILNYADLADALTMDATTILTLGANNYTIDATGAGQFEVIGTASGRILHAQDQLRSSGSLVIEGNAAIQGVLTLTSALTVANGGTALSALPTKSLSLMGLRGASVAGAMIKQVNYSANAVDVTVAEYGENGTAQYAYVQGILPDGYNGGTFTTRIHWTTAATTGDIEWNIQCRIYGDNEALDAAWGTAVQVTDTAATTNTVRITSASSAMTCAGTPAGNKTVLFRIWRDSADAQDTMTGSGRLIGGLSEFGLNSYSD